MLGGQGIHLLGGHDDVLVVGQNENRLGGHLVYRLQNVLGAGIHGLAAGDDLVNAQIQEHVRKACAGTDGYHAQGLLGLGNLGSQILLVHDLLGVLQAHILHLHGDEGAVVNGLAQSLAGVIGVDMNLDDLIVVHQHQAVAQLAQEGTKLLGILVVLPADDELGAVGKGNVLGVEVGEVRSFLHRRRVGGRLCHHILALNGGQHGLQGSEPALAAGIHNPRLLQNRVLVDGVCQGNLGLLHGGILNEFDEVILLRGLLRLGGSQSGDGENGALGRLHNRLVGRVHALLKRLCPQNAVTVGASLELPGDTPEQQGQNHAGVAPGTPEHSGSGNFRGSAQIRVIRLAQVSGGGGDGHGHIRAGIAVGHREHIQLVQGLLVVFNGGCRADNHSAQIRAVDCLFQDSFPPILSRSSWSPHRR